MLRVPFLLKVNDPNMAGNIANASRAFTKICLRRAYLFKLRVSHHGHIFQVEQQVDIILYKISQTFAISLRSA